MFQILISQAKSLEMVSELNIGTVRRVCFVQTGVFGTEMYQKQD